MFRDYQPSKHRQYLYLAATCKKIFSDNPRDFENFPGINSDDSDVSKVSGLNNLSQYDQ